MAERRMFSKAVIGSGRFLQMPATSRLLYYDLGMQADDDGIDPSVTLDWANLEALCQECHNKEHSPTEHCTAIFDSSGEMVGVEESAEIEEYKKAIEALKKKMSIFQEKAD